MVEMSNKMLDGIAAAIQGVEFDHPFAVEVYAPNVARLSFPDGVYAPSVVHDDETDVRIESDGWEALTGFTGQQSYNGAVNHPSEFVGREIARELVRREVEDGPQVYVITSVEVEATDDEVKDKARELGLDYTTDAGWDAAREAADAEQEAAGWAILRKV